MAEATISGSAVGETKTHPTPARNTASRQGSGGSGKRSNTSEKNVAPSAETVPIVEPRWYSQQAVESLQPIRLLMISFGRLPIRLKLNLVDKYEFVFQWGQPRTIVFLLITSIIAVQGLLIVLSIFSHLSDVPAIQGVVPDYFHVRPNPRGLNTTILRAEEQYIFRRNLVALIVTCCYIFQGLLASLLFFFRRNFVCYFLSFILEAAEMTRINLAYGSKRFMWFFVGCWFLGLVALIACALSTLAPVTSGSCSIMAIMTYRIFYPPIHSIGANVFKALRGFHGLLFIIIIVNAKVYIMLFVWCCRMIRNGFVTWNGRVDRVLLRDEQEKSEEEREIHRTKLGQLFTDHVVLLDLTQGVDRVFAGTIEIYYFSQVISLGFGMYFFVRNLLQLDSNPGEEIIFYPERRADCAVVGMFVIMSAVILFHVTMSPAEINDEALEGLEVIRRRGFMGKKSDEELYFILSMYVSYTGHYEIAVVCGNYFTMDKTLFITFLGTMCVYFVLMCQLKIPLTLKSLKAETDIIDYGRAGDQSVCNKILWQTEAYYFKAYGCPTCC